MTMERRAFTIAAAVAAATLGTPLARAQSDKAIKLIVPFPPGAATDQIARALALKLSPRLGQPVIVDNKGGAAGAIGSDFVSKSAPDGQTLLVGTTSTHGTNPVVSRTPYDPVEGFSHISLLATSPLVFLAHPSVPAADLKEFVRHARAHPGLAFGSNGNGSYNHLAVEMLEQLAQIDLLHVPYRGAAPVLADLTAGQIVFGAADLAGATPFIRSGKLKPLAVASAEPVPGFDIPTVIESGFPGYEVPVWYALFGPAGMPPEIVARIHSAVVESVQAPDFRDRFLAQGTITQGGTPAQLRDFVVSENVRWSGVAKAAKIRVD